jgi:hypothetical protein
MAKMERVMAFGLVGMLAVGAASKLHAVPALTNGTATEAAALNTVTGVSWRGWRGRGYRCVTNDGQRRFRSCEHGGN